MSRVLLVLLALLALTGAVAWYALAANAPRRGPAAARALESARAAGARPAAASEVVAPDASPSASAPEQTARAAVPSAGEAALANAHWVEGRVRFPPGTPTDEVLDVLADGRDFDDGSDHRARVEPDGRFRVAFSERTRTGKLRLEGRYLFLREPVRWRREADESESLEPILLEPELGGRIEVQVVPPTTAPPGDVRGAVDLASTRRSASSFSFSGYEGRSAELNEGLAVAFDALDVAREYRVSFDGEEFVSGTVLPAVEPGRSASVRLDLFRGTPITGHVRDTSGTGVAGADVSVTSDGPRLHDLPARHRGSETQSDGAFRVGALPVGRLKLSVEHPGFEPFEQSFEERAEGVPLEVEIVLQRGASIAGRVQWPDGEPARAELMLVERIAQGEDPYRSHRATGSAGPDGRFAISGLTAARYIVQASATHTTEVLVVSEITGRERLRKQRSRWVAEVDSVAVGSREVTLVLSPGRTVRGRVLDGAGEPLDDVFVSSSRLSFPRSTADDRQAPSGRFRNADGSFELAGFQPGLWSVSASATGFCPSDSVEVRVPSEQPIELRLEREAGVRGVVLGVDGRPAPGLEVSALQPGRGESRFDLFGQPAGVTDSAGAFSIEGLHGGLTHLSATSPDGVPSEPLEVELVPGETLADVVVTLRRGCSLEGEVLDSDGRPEAGVVVQYHTQDNGSFRGFRSDENGRFQGHGLPPGPARLWAQNRDGLTLTAEVELQVDSVARVRLAAPVVSPVRVFGRVRFGGRPLEGSWVFADRSATSASDPTTGASVQSRERTDAEGRYELRLPVAGRWLMRVYEPQGAGLTLPLDVPEVEAFEHDFDIAAGLVRGHVRSVVGEPLVGVEVRSEPRMHDGGARGQASTRTDLDGRYELTLPVGRHTLIAGGPSGSRAASNWCAVRIEDLHVTDGSAQSGLDFELVQGGSLSGAVSAPGGGPARFVALWSCGAGRPELLEHTSDSGGFELSSLPEGTLWIRATGPKSATQAASAVEIRHGTAARVELQLVAATPLRVRVLSASGEPLGSEIDVRDASGRPVPESGPSETGLATFGPLAPGTYRVRAQREDQLAERTLEVSGHEAELELVLGFE